MASQPPSLYGTTKPRKLAGTKEISSSTTLSFTSHLSSLINTPNPSSTTKPPRIKLNKSKDDIFSSHNRNTHKRAKRDLDPDAGASFEQKHTTNGDALESSVWERSKRKMEAKARLYAAMKRGDVEDTVDKYAVDFDRKWAESADAREGEAISSDDGEDDASSGMVEYTDEFGRTRTGTASDAARAERTKRGAKEATSDRFTARPNAPENVIYGDAIQHAAFDPDAPMVSQMEALAAKRDRSLTPPAEEHFDGGKEIRTKGTGFFQFSGDAEERKRQMEGLERERGETERKREERVSRIEERRRVVDARRAEIQQRRGKRKADDFLDQLGEELGASVAVRDGGGENDMAAKIEAAIAREEDEGV